MTRDRLCALLRRGRRRRSGARDGRGRTRGSGARTSRRHSSMGVLRIWPQASASSTSSRSAARSIGSTGQPSPASIASSSRRAGFSPATPEASKTAAIPGSTRSRLFAIVGGTIGRPMTQGFLRRRTICPGRVDQRRSGLFHSRRTARRSHLVDVHLVAGAARRRSSRDEDRHEPGARALRARRRH